MILQTQRPNSSIKSTKQPNHAAKSVQQGGFILSFILVIVIIVGLMALVLYLIHQDRIITSKFEGKRWNIPAKVYSQPLVLYQDAYLTHHNLENWLTLLNYRQTNDYQQSGTYKKQGNDYIIHTREFQYNYADKEPKQILKITIQDNHIHKIQSTYFNHSGIVRLEPVLIGGIYPDNNEDRIVMNIKDVPQPLIDALIATEDRSFYEHKGISLRGIGRAIYSNSMGGKRQGGSTITQQLIKNFYLNSERTLKRKVNEAMMAILLELHYSKTEILQAYLNEINLGQNGNHSINGFGLASQFYFNRPLNELRIDQMAMLVGLAKGPSQYNPLRNPKSALERRNVVLHNMLVMGKLSQEDYETAIAQPLDIGKNPIIGKSRFPAFLDIVKRELNKHYELSDLKNEGLRIFSTLEPNVQISADMAVRQSIANLRQSNPKLLANLQTALVTANPKNGELLAIVGSGDVFTGFNRAVDAKRQVGSLLKPVVYLTALENGHYNLASGVNDAEVNIRLADGSFWTPKNYDNISHGIVPLTTALAQSYNQALVNVGMEVGMPKIINQLYRMGIKEKLPSYPSTLLGSVSLSPMDMLEIYQVLATGGFKNNLYSIRSVVDKQGRVVQGYNQENQQVANPTASYLTNYAMQQVIKQGTGKLALSLGETLNLAGKTGTTNDYRDAWFAGYSGNYVSVVWVGRDDNASTGLSGGNGALPIWINFMKRLQLAPVELKQPNTVEWFWLEYGTGKLSEQSCQNAVYLPINRQQMPEDSDCLVQAYRKQQEAKIEEQRVKDALFIQQRQQERLNQIEQNSQSYEENVTKDRPLVPEARSQSWFEKSVSEFLNN